MKSHLKFLPVLVCMAAFPAICTAQNTPTSSGQQSPAGAIPYSLYSLDLNNDGFPDIVEDKWETPPSTNGFNVQLGRGDGTFKTPVFYAVNDSAAVPTPMAVGDFNNDGKADVAVVLPGKSQIAVFLGEGDGTFQTPKYSTVTLDAGQTFASAPAAAANFNGDGKLDLIAVGEAGSQQNVYVLAGDGSGGFSSPKVISNLPTYYQAKDLAIGDFDGDGHADAAFAAVFGCGGSGSCTTVVHALFGDGAFGFQETTPYSTYDPLHISGGDVDSDGISDLVGHDSTTEQMIVFYGQTDRVFASYSWPLQNVSNSDEFADGWYGPFQIADLNGDGHMDITGYFSNTVREGTNHGFQEFLGTANRGQFTQYWDYAPDSGNYVTPFGTPPVAMDANRDGRPDLVINQPPAASGNNGYPSTLYTAVNTTSGGYWGGCIYPKSAQGIHLCGPGTSSTSGSLTFKASATSFGQMRKLELWVDGKKMAQNFHAWEHNAWFKYTGTFAAGSHHGTLFAVDVDYRLQKLPISFTVGSTTCAPPGSYGVHICSPVNGSTVTSPVTVQAAAKISGKLARMEVWVDSVKKFTETTSTSFTTKISLAKGKHRFTVFAVNTAGTKYKTTVYATVN